MNSHNYVHQTVELTVFFPTENGRCFFDELEKTAFGTLSFANVRSTCLGQWSSGLHNQARPVNNLLPLSCCIEIFRVPLLARVEPTDRSPLSYISSVNSFCNYVFHRLAAFD